MERLFQIGHRAPHTIPQRLAVIFDIIQEGTVPLPGHHLPQERSEYPHNGSILCLAVALDGHSVYHGKTYKVAHLHMDLGHDTRTGRELKRRQPQMCYRLWVLP